MSVVGYHEEPRSGTSQLHPLTELNRRSQPIEEAWAFGYHLRRCLHVGADDSGWILARPERSLLVIGPPRDTGKTTAVLVPTVLTAYAPVVAASTKDDVFAATAQTRALMGRLWHFAPDGSEPTPAGARKLRWSPVPAAKDWDMAVTTAEVMISVANATLGGHSSADGGFWSIQAGGLLAPLFHAAALADLDMRTVMRWVMLRDLSEAARILEGLRHHSPGTRTAYELLGGAARTARNELSGYWGSANAALAPYRRESALEVTDRPNFDPTRFVIGRPRDNGEAWFDTVYINSSGLNQERLAPLIVALLTEIKEARYRIARAMRARTDVYLPPTVLALDETANIAPIPDLPSIISQGGSQGVVVAAVFQHLQQAKARWGADGTGFLTTFQERLIFPGIWEPETLEAISVVVGEWDRPMTSFSEDAHSRDPRRSSYQSPLCASGSCRRLRSRPAVPRSPRRPCSSRVVSTGGSTPPVLQLPAVAAPAGHRHGALGTGARRLPPAIPAHPRARPDEPGHGCALAVAGRGPGTLGSLPQGSGRIAAASTSASPLLTRAWTDLFRGGRKTRSSLPETTDVGEGMPFVEFIAPTIEVLREGFVE